jgi:hypothetical protein
MADITRFLGTWTANPGAPMSNHTFTWALDGTRLRGSWLIEAVDFPAAPAALAAGHPGRLELQVGEPTLEGDRLLFDLNGGPYPTEFRLVAPDEAVAGAAVDKLPSAFSGPEYRRSIEGHRVRLVRRAEAWISPRLAPRELLRAQ